MDYEYDIGFLGGGQLARMSIMAAHTMGLKCLSLDTGQDTPASHVAACLAYPASDPQGVRELASRCERLTFESEFVPVPLVREGLTAAGRGESCLNPSLQTLATIQDKLCQHHAYESHGTPGAKTASLSEAERLLGYPFVAKSRFGGYDGKGTRTVRGPSEIEAAWTDETWYAEAFIPFQRELAVMVARWPGGHACFPTMETVQTDHVCDLVFPACADAADVALRAVEAVQGYGLFGVELFELEGGEILVNEVAPRPHNSGHYSLDWGGLSQFDVHIRLVMGWPVPPLSGLETCMANLLGQPGAMHLRAAEEAALKAEPGCRIHWYGKADSRPGRKMGHLNVVGDGCVDRAKRARDAFYRGWVG